MQHMYRYLSYGCVKGREEGSGRSVSRRVLALRSLHDRLPKEGYKTGPASAHATGRDTHKRKIEKKGDCAGDVTT